MEQPRLLDLVRRRCRLKHYSFRTEGAYVRFHGMTRPRDLGDDPIEQSLSDLATNRLTGLAEQNAWRAFHGPLHETEWVAYAKPPFGSPELVLKYLARYTHRVAISTRCLLSLEDDHVSFRYKDLRHGRRDRVMRLDLDEFMRRFLLHVLPAAFVRIRHFGLLKNRSCAGNLARCRELLGTPTHSTLPSDRNRASHCHPGKPCDRCLACRTGILIFAGILPPSRTGPRFTAALPSYA